MKASRYNIILYDDCHAYWYNGLHDNFFRISDSLSSKIEPLLESPDSYSELSSAFYEKLLKYGFIIEDDVDELDIIRIKNEETIHSKDYFLVILPTLNCNFKCWYCIQDHIFSKMDSSVIEMIKMHIDAMIDKHGITSLCIEWFGGEPFMYFDEVIRPISEYAIEKCRNSGIPFRNSATTNAYYITDKIARSLESLEFRNFQITLDGPKGAHDRVKFQKGLDSAFDHVLHNINNFLHSVSDVTVSLRINYTHESLTEKIVGEVSDIIQEDVRGRIKITPRKVWQEKPDKSIMKKVRGILDLFEDKGFKVERCSYIRSFVPCYANKEYYNAINYNGNVVKCTACNDLYEETHRGKLLSDGEIEWRDGFDKKYQAKSFDNPRCLACRKLPVCMGQCPRNHINGISSCKYEHTDTTLEEELLDMMRNSYRQQKA